MTYTTMSLSPDGERKGGCGHTHQTIEAAADCNSWDHKACRALGHRYSDRQVVRGNGDPLDAAEVQHLREYVGE